MTANAESNRVPLASVLNIANGSVLFGLGIALGGTAWMLEPIFASTLQRFAWPSETDGAAEAARVVLVAYLIAVPMAISGAAIAIMQMRLLFRNWSVGFWERLIGSSAIVACLAVLPMVTGAFLILGTGYLLLLAHGNKIAESDIAAFQRTAAIVHRANEITEERCTLPLQAMELYQPVTAFGATAKGVLWSAMYAPAVDADGTAVGDPCIATAEAISSQIEQLQDVVQREAMTYRRIPYTRFIAELNHASLRQEECSLRQLQNGASYAQATEVCRSISGDDASS